MDEERKSVTISELRTNIYKMFDEALKTGEPILISRGGRTLKIVPDSQPEGRLARLKPQPGLLCAAEELVEISWEHEWDADGSVS